MSTVQGNLKEDFVDKKLLQVTYRVGKFVKYFEIFTCFLVKITKILSLSTEYLLSTFFTKYLVFVL